VPSECLFCGIADGEIPADIVHSDELVVAFRDINPKAPTHILLISREHIESAAELTDDNIEYARLARDAQSDLDALSAESTNDERLQAVVRLIRARLAGRPVIPESVRAAVRRVTVANGNLRVSNLASEIGITRQQLARQFATHVGVTPKTFARVIRAQTALARADAARAAYPRIVDWSAIAYDLGYYDQPHFIDDFKALTGVTPSKWERESS